MTRPNLEVCPGKKSLDLGQLFREDDLNGRLLRALSLPCVAFISSRVCVGSALCIPASSHSPKDMRPVGIASVKGCLSFCVAKIKLNERKLFRYQRERLVVLGIILFYTARRLESEIGPTSARPSSRRRRLRSRISKQGGIFCPVFIRRLPVETAVLIILSLRCRAH